MKIAIPTDDGLTVAQQFRSARGFLVFTLQLGEILQQEMRWNDANDTYIKNDASNANLVDCDGFLVHNRSTHPGMYLQSFQKEIIGTDETIITKALLKYLNSSLLKETNVCCCP